MEIAFFFVGVRLLNARVHPRVYTYARYGEGGCYEDRIPRETPRKIGSPVPAKYVCLQGSYLDPTRVEDAAESHSAYRGSFLLLLSLCISLPGQT